MTKMAEQGKKPIKFNLEYCYSGFTVEELEYIDYTRTVTEKDDEVGNSTWEFYQDRETQNSTTNLNDELLADTDETGFDSRYPSVEELRSYMCSTPTRRRRELNPEYFTQDVDVDISRITDLSADHARRNYARSRSNSVISIFDERGSMRSSVDMDSMQNLYETDDEGIDTGGNRRKIELDSDLKDPLYVNIDDLEVSIEEEQPERPTSTFGSLRRRMSLKLSRQNTASMGFYGSYLPRNQPQLSAPNGRPGDPSSTSVPPRSNPGRGPINFWFRKLRNRHFI